MKLSTELIVSNIPTERGSNSLLLLRASAIQGGLASTLNAIKKIVRIVPSLRVAVMATQSEQVRDYLLVALSRCQKHTYIDEGKIVVEAALECKDTSTGETGEIGTDEAGSPSRTLRVIFRIGDDGRRYIDSAYPIGDTGTSPMQH